MRSPRSQRVALPFWFAYKGKGNLEQTWNTFVIKDERVCGFSISGVGTVQMSRRLKRETKLKICTAEGGTWDLESREDMREKT